MQTIFLGEFMQLDWDMFHSLHPMAKYHAATRAVGGCPIYVSWCKVGKKYLIHNESPGTVISIIRAKDVDYLSGVADDKWKGDAIIFCHLSGPFVNLLIVDGSQPRRPLVSEIAHVQD